MGTTKNKIRKTIWQEDLERKLNELLQKGFDLRGIKTLSRRSRRAGEPEQNLYRVVFVRHAEVQVSEQPVQEEPVTVK